MRMSQQRANLANDIGKTTSFNFEFSLTAFSFQILSQFS